MTCRVPGSLAASSERARPTWLCTVEHPETWTHLEARGGQKNSVLREISANILHLIRA